MFKTEKRTCLAAILILLALTGAEAQSLTQTVRGIVTERYTGMPVPGVTVVIIPTDPLLGSATGEDGKFKLDKVPVGRYDIHVTCIGYEPQVMKEVLIGSGKEAVLEVRLEESATQLDAVVVSDRNNKEQPLNPMALISTRQLSVEEASRYAGGFDDPARLASSFAGVTGTLSNNGIVIRGNTPRGLLWQMEGIEIPNPSHFADVIAFGAGGITALSSQMLANSDFHTGAFPAEYGNALSGVFDIRLRNGNNEKRESTFQLGVIGTDISTEGPFRKGGNSSYLFNYRYSTFSLLAPLLPEDAAGNRYQDLSFKLNFPSAKAGTFTFWGLGAYDQTKVEAETCSTEWKYDQDMERVKSDQGMSAAGLGYKRTLGKASLLNASLAFSGSGLGWDLDRIDSALVMHPSENLTQNNWKYTLTGSISHKFRKGPALKTGICAESLNYNITTGHAATPGAIPEVNVSAKGSNTLLRSYIQAGFTFTPKVQMVAGINAQYFELNREFSPEPRLNIRWEPVAGRSFSLGYGNHSRTEILNIYLARVYHGPEYTLPNQSLKLTRAHHVVAAYNQDLGEFLHLRVEPYFQRLYHIPVMPGSSFSVINLDKNWFIADSLVSSGEGKNSGVDFTLERYLNKGYYFLITASVFDSKYKDSGNKWRNTRYNRNFVVNLLAGREWMVGKKGKNNILGVSVKVTGMGGEKISPVDTDASRAARDVVYDESRAYENSKPEVLYASITLNYRVNRPKYAGIWSLQLINATGTKEFYGHRYNYLTKGVEEEKEAIFVPAISYKIEF